MPSSGPSPQDSPFPPDAPWDDMPDVGRSDALPWYEEQVRPSRGPLVLAFLAGCIVGETLLTLYVLVMLHGVGL